MDYARALANIATGGVRYGANTASYMGKMASRIALSGLRRTCVHCNNLTPYGHENAFGRDRGFFQSWEDPNLIAGRAQQSNVPSLVIEDYAVKNLLQCRQKDANGKPKSDCRYCHLLCNVMDAFFEGWETDFDWDPDGGPRTLTLTIREESPIVVSCYRFVHDPNRVDIEIYFEPETIAATKIAQPDAKPIGTVAARAADSSSPACIAFIRDAVKECCKEHSDCNKSFGDFVPTRFDSHCKRWYH